MRVSKDTQLPLVPEHVARIVALDFAKGSLVLIMVLYHWINYFIGDGWSYYRYLHFLTPSFILITGFLISNVYFARRNMNGGALRMRLVTRGIKLLLIFLCANIAKVGTLWIASVHEPSVILAGIRGIATALCSGNVYLTSGKLVTFYILVPIGYLLICSAILERFNHSYEWTFQSACLICLLAIATSALFGVRSDNLEMVCIGLLGAWAGFVPIASVNLLARRIILIAMMYSLYLAAISRWNVPFPLLAFGAALNVLVLYSVGMKTAGWGIAGRKIVLLGKYSLFGYLVQIFILQGLALMSKHMGQSNILRYMTFVGAFALTIWAVEILDRARRYLKFVDQMYKVVFS